ncbi:MAG: hypothetical protein HY821_13185 [Acidobacteria bacterium]|nr:hypothetical protein [Acidobacteriota bacterium]
MKRKRKVEGPDPRETFIDSLMRNPAGVRRELGERRNGFWATRAAAAASELARAEIAVRCAERHDLPQLWLAERRAQRTLAEFAQRAGIDAGALIKQARAEAAEKVEEATEGNGAQETPEASEHTEGGKVA